MEKRIDTKTMLAFLFEQMEKLDRNEISADTACAQAKLASQANNLLDYELRRTVVQLKLAECGQHVKPTLREIESGTMIIGDRQP